MMASLKQTTKSTEKLEKAFKNLLAATMPKNKHFIVSKDNQSSTELTFFAVNAILTFNKNVKESAKIPNVSLVDIREYFAVSAAASVSSSQAFVALEALNRLQTVPFVKLESGQTQTLGTAGSVTLQLCDLLGTPIKAKDSRLTSAALRYTSGESVDATSFASHDGPTGQVKISLDSSLPRGNFLVELTLDNETTLKPKESVRVSAKIDIQDF